ncbi:threonine synthase, partial [Candidatus Bathyarchaeota archaeon]
MTLECIDCGSKFSLATILKGRCEKCGGLLEYKIVLPKHGRVKFSGQRGFWRYKPLLPQVKNKVSLGEGG